MDDFNLDFFVDELKESFNIKKARLALALHAVGWETDIAWLNGDDPDIDEIVEGVVQSAAKRRDFEQKQDLMLFEEADTIQTLVNDWIFLAAINWYAGLRLLASDWRDGFRLLLKSTELIDMCRGILEHVILQQNEAEKKERAIHGGKAKAALFSPLKAEVIRLLQDKQPEGGWKSKNAAIDAIDVDIRVFIEQHGFPASSGEQNTGNNQSELCSRIPRLVSDWSRNDVDVKAAFAAVVKQKKKSAPKGAE
ncbi:hypothetical protein ACFLPV_001752 [Serratia marcescens]|uniref:hypothetical protein n=1 Tax=unclassified Serratia (in: enterobacteria) TaxID=2647522 RepID=UPI0024AF89AA|nr:MULTISPECIES: hypothetical protein [unclassified Serratia (in: enterobacteria)]EMB6252910.1 hypothetical protein [Serratia marcescens]MDI6974267.1 hypothetical protein [Serratia sp. Se-RSBMAAmG]MDI9262602.1 hypothetical protein [Serratia sp. PF2-63]MDI9268440.1 hypothetical protein [Serratia sp. PF-27]